MGEDLHFFLISHCRFIIFDDISMDFGHCDRQNCSLYPNFLSKCFIHTESHQKFNKKKVGPIHVFSISENSL